MDKKNLKGTSKNYPSAALDSKFSRSTYILVRLPPKFSIRLASGQVFRGATKKNFLSCFILNFFLLLLPSIGAFKAEAAVFSRTQLMMGDIPVTIQINTSSKKKEKAFLAMEASFKEAKRLELIFSSFHKKSDVNRLNHSDGRKWIRVNPEIISLLESSIILSQWTHGAYDVTYSSLDKRNNYSDILIDKNKNKVKLARKSVKININSMAKGILVDQMHALLLHHGFKNHLVNAGGDLYARGRWFVAIRGTPITLVVRNQAVASAGISERGAHIINPKTDKPVLPPYETVTVVAQSASMANPLATTGFVMGPQEFKKVLDDTSLGEPPLGEPPSGASPLPWQTKTGALFVYSDKMVIIGKIKMRHRGHDSDKKQSMEF